MLLIRPQKPLSAQPKKILVIRLVKLSQLPDDDRVNIRMSSPFVFVQTFFGVIIQPDAIESFGDVIYKVLVA